MVKNKRCSDTCDNCIYVGEGDFICLELQELVIEDWIFLNRYCKLKYKEGTDGCCNS